MEPNALPLVESANILMMTGTVPSESMFSRLEILNSACINDT